MRGETIEAFSIAVRDPDGDDVTVTVSGLPPGLTWSSETGMVSGTVAADAALQAHTVTVTANDSVNDPVIETFTITVAMNRTPVITVPETKVYEQREAIEAFSIAVRDPDGDDVTVTVSGLPPGLTWSSETGMVSGTVAADAALQTHTVTVTANDGVSDAATETFTITVVNSAPTITNPGNKRYPQGEAIEAFSIDVTDANVDDTVTVTVSGLPMGLTWSSETGMVSGTVASDAASSSPYTGTVTADDGVNEAVTATFTIAVDPVWILLRDSLTVTRGIIGFTRTGAGPDNSGAWALRQARWYYAAGETGHTIVQYYSDVGWAYGGSANVGCLLTDPGSVNIGSAYRTTSGTPQLSSGFELLDSGTSVFRRDTNGNTIPRVPTGYTDDPARLWTMRFARTSITRISTRCRNNANQDALLFYTDIPLPPSS